jgi:VanZ family protein
VNASLVRWISRWAPVAIYMALIFSVSADPDPPAPEAVSDKLLHLLAYAGLAVVVFRAVAGGLPARVTPPAAVFTLLITIAYAASDEFHQLFVPNRSADVHDLYADIAGTAIALIGCWAWDILESRIADPRSGIADPQSGIADPQSGIADPQSGIADPQSGIADPRSRVPTPRGRGESTHGDSGSIKDSRFGSRD